jgi:hypothetical protein
MQQNAEVYSIKKNIAHFILQKKNECQKNIADTALYVETLHNSRRTWTSWKQKY